MNSKTTYDIHGKPYSRTLMILLLLVATFAGVLNQTTLGTAIPTLMKSFHISMATAQEATTWFLLANGIMIPVSAFLATRFSTKWLYIWAYSLLIIGLLMTTLAPTSSWTIFFVRTYHPSLCCRDYHATYAGCDDQCLSQRAVRNCHGVKWSGCRTSTCCWTNASGLDFKRRLCHRTHPSHVASNLYPSAYHFNRFLDFITFSHQRCY